MYDDAFLDVINHGKFICVLHFPQPIFYAHNLEGTYMQVQITCTHIGPSGQFKYIFLQMSKNKTAPFYPSFCLDSLLSGVLETSTAVTL